MRTVSASTFARKCREGEWECEYEASPSGVAWVRSCRTGKRFPVRVEG